jgi:alanine racemase
VSVLPDERWAWAEVDLDAVVHNVRTLRQVVAPSDVWVVVKADGYGHGSIPVSLAAIDAGATGLAVALVSEGVALRDAGILDPILVLSEQPPETAAAILAHRLTPTVSTSVGIASLAAAASASDESGVGVHLKIDTGMHRVGARPQDAPALAEEVAATGSLYLAGVFTHFAVADEIARPETAAAIALFDEARATLPPVDAVHAANSAAAIAHPAARYSFVRIGIAAYGVSPGADLDEAAAALRPALALKAKVSFVKRLAAGESLSYGLRYTLPVDANIATVPIGYADGVRRNLTGRDMPVLIGGRRHPIVGTVTMDQILVDCGNADVAVGDEVVLLGEQGGERIRAEDWGACLGTIGYAITCGIGARVQRRYLRGGEPVGP